MNLLGRRLRELRLAQGLTIQQVAESLGKTPGYISRVETRDEIPSAELLVAFAELFSVDPAELLALAKEVQLGRVSRDIDAKHGQALELYRRGKA